MKTKNQKLRSLANLSEKEQERFVNSFLRDVAIYPIGKANRKRLAKLLGITTRRLTEIIDVYRASQLVELADMIIYEGGME